MIIYDEEVFFIDSDKPDTTMIYAPLRSFLSITSTEIANKIKNKEANSYFNEFFTYLKSKPLVNIQGVQKAYINQMPRLSLAITDDCQLRCNYCYMSAGDEGKNKSMSKDTIYNILKRYFDYIARNFPENNTDIEIRFFGGGEPLYKIELIKYAINTANSFATQYGKKCHFVTATNGYFGSEVRKFVLDNFSVISFSLDGPQHIQDLHRPTKKGRGSFNQVMETAKFFYENKIQMGFRATISSYSISYYKEIVDFFSTNFPNCGLSLEPLFPMGRGNNNNTNLQAPLKSDFANMLLKTVEYSKNKSIFVRNAAIGKMEMLKTSFCGAVGTPSWCVLTDNRLASCTRDNSPEIFNIGYFDEFQGGFIIDKQKEQNLFNFNVFSFSECKDCFCKYNCAGDCPDLRLLNIINCDSNRAIAKYILQEKLEINI